MSFKKIDCNLTQKFDEYPDFGVLNGVKVFVSGTAIAGPFAGCLMAGRGAKVLQSEAPKISCGTRGTTSWSQNHRNEFSITCNPRTPAGKKIFKKCLEWADIWIESSKAGTYAKMGLTDEVCWGVNSKLCIVHVSGYGQTGPYKSKASYDVSGQARGGYMYMNGVSPTSTPLKVNPYLSDYVTAYNACMTALSAYIHALKTGKGESCDVAQYDTMFRLLANYPVLWYNKGYPKDGEPVPYRTGNHSDLAACFSFYTTKDNKQLIVTINGPGPPEKGYPILGAGHPGPPVRKRGHQDAPAATRRRGRRRGTGRYVGPRRKRRREPVYPRQRAALPGEPLRRPLLRLQHRGHPHRGLLQIILPRRVRLPPLLLHGRAYARRQHGEVLRLRQAGTHLRRPLA